MYKNEDSFKDYLLEKGFQKHSATGYIAYIKNLIDPAIKEYINANAASILDEENASVLWDYLDRIKADSRLIELNKKKSMHMTAPIAKYAQYLQYKKQLAQPTSNASKKTMKSEGRDIATVMEDMAVFRKYKLQVPTELQEEYKTAYLRNALSQIKKGIAKELEKYEGHVEFTVKYDKNNGVQLVQSFNEVELTEPKKKSDKTSFIVKFPDGAIIKGHTAKDCFVNTILHIGIDRVQNLGLKFYTMPLLGSHLSSNKIYASGQVEVRPGLFLMTSGPTERKIQMLKKIDSFLKIGITIEQR